MCVCTCTDFIQKYWRLNLSLIISLLGHKNTNIDLNEKVWGIKLTEWLQWEHCCVCSREGEHERVLRMRDASDPGLRKDECKCQRWRRREEGRRWTRSRVNLARGKARINSSRTPSIVDRTACPLTLRARIPSECRSSTSTISPVTATESALMWAGSFTFISIKALGR